ncbi:MAG: hypothetical protein E7265_12110 [Lachnospiraceae bacterium]|nr:hypothetical protein [Lachnospiraceae bacterium]
MNKKQGTKGKWHSFIEWCKDIGGLIKENRNIVIAVIVFVALVAVAIIVSTMLGKKSPSAEVVAEVVTETTTVAETEEETTLAIPDEPLMENAYAEVNELVKKYYQAMADGDMNTLLSITTGLDEKEQIKIVKKSEYVENYPTVTCYTKQGPIADSYIVYAYYEVKLVDFETLTPGMNALYVCKNEKGAYYVNGETQSDEIIDYCEMISAQDDVVDLVNTVQVKYNEIKATDTELSQFLDELPDILTAAVGEELAKLEAETNEAAVPETPVTEVTSEESEGTEPAEASEDAVETVETVVKTVRTTEVVNVRSSDSVTADKVGKAQLGQEYDLLEEKPNGWSKIKFEGKEAYIKTEYLEPAKVEETVVGADEEENADADSPSEGTATVTDTVNIRKSASTSADKLGICYPGDEVEVVKKQDDGWSKIKYKDITGYIKSEFLE